MGDSGTDDAAVLDHLKARAIAGDVDAAFDLGRLLCTDDVLAANAWFKLAARLGRLPTVRRVVDYLEAHPPADDPQLPAVWKRRAAIAEFPRPDAPYIHAALSLFATLGDSGMAEDDADGSIVVQAADAEAAAVALGAAADNLRAGIAEVSAVSVDDSGAHITIRTDRPRFGVTRAAVHEIITALLAVGVRAAYLRPRSSVPWMRESELEPDPDFPVAEAMRRADTDETGDFAFAVGVWCHGNLHRDHGDAWFKRAAAIGPFETFWRIVDYYAIEDCYWNGERLQNSMQRAWRAEFPRVDAPRIHLNETLFAPIVLDGGAGYGHDTSILVRCVDPSAATRALSAASLRFGLVTADGRTLAGDDELNAALLGDDDGDWRNYTPNFVIDISYLDGHPSLWMDWKDMMAPRMAHAMAHILVDELLAAGVTQAWIKPRPPEG